MTETWYKTGGYGRVLIEPVEVDRATDACVWINNRRNARISSFTCYYPTWEAARDALLAEKEDALNAARRRLERAQGEYGNIKGLQRPA